MDKLVSDSKAKLEAEAPAGYVKTVRTVCKAEWWVSCMPVPVPVACRATPRLCVPRPAPEPPTRPPGCPVVPQPRTFLAPAACCRAYEVAVVFDSYDNFGAYMSSEFREKVMTPAAASAGALATDPSKSACPPPRPPWPLCRRLACATWVSGAVC